MKIQNSKSALSDKAVDRIAVGLIAAAGVTVFGVLVGAVYVVVHFIGKFW